MAKGKCKNEKAELERRRKISETRKRKMKQNGYLNSKKTRQKISAAALGRQVSDETREKMSLAKKGVTPSNFEDCLKKAHESPDAIFKKEGAEHPRWKGSDVGYSALHAWVRKVKGMPSKCEHCGTEKAKKFEWANKSGEYLRKIDDWLRLCTRCHRAYDMRVEIKET